jgi:hypothetical protein
VFSIKKDIRPNWQVEQLQALIESSELVNIAGAEHYIWLTHYNEMRFELRRFLEGLNDSEKDY